MMRRLRDTLLPPACLGCDRPADDLAISLCGACARNLPPLPLCCPVCGDALPPQVSTCQACANCQKRKPAFARTIAALAYAPPVDDWIGALKYRGQLRHAGPLAGLLARAVASQPKPDLLIPVPLHDSKLRSRGFNQAIELTRPLARELELPWRHDLARRLRPTPPQQGQTATQRRRNLRGAFAAKDEIAGLHVAIVDDVMTTGATADALAQSLKKAGAAEVSAWVVARALRD
ncbi:ComF family protein [bacterium]|nr:ComF family protein [bacterium]